jgi:hypothetical protein
MRIHTLTFILKHKYIEFYINFHTYVRRSFGNERQKMSATWSIQYGDTINGLGVILLSERLIL